MMRRRAESEAVTSDTCDFPMVFTSLRFLSSRGGQRGLIPVLSAAQPSLLVADGWQPGNPCSEPAGRGSERSPRSKGFDIRGEKCEKKEIQFDHVTTADHTW